MSEIRRALTLGVGRFAHQMTLSLYNAFMPLLYAQFIASKPLIGLFMTLDNMLSLVLEPWWAARSDRRSLRWGRRGFIVGGMLAAACSIFLIPIASGRLLTLLMATIVLNICLTIFPGPLNALMADLFPYRTRAQRAGIMTMLAGLGTVFVLVSSSVLLPLNRAYPFVLAGCALFVAAGLIAVAIKEPRSSLHAQDEESTPIIAGLRMMLRSPDKSPLMFLVATCCFMFAWGGRQAWWTTFATNDLHLPPERALLIGAVQAFSYAFWSIPAGMAAARFGRRLVIMFGLVVLVCAYAGCALTVQPLMISALFLFAGIGWACVLVNGIVMFQEFTHQHQAGLYTGIFSISVSLALIAAPPIYGFLMQLFGSWMLWAGNSLFALCALILTSQVREAALPSDAQPVPSASLG